MPTATPFAILRTEKIKTWGELQKSQGHTMRTSQDERAHLAGNIDEPISVLVGLPDWVDGWRQEVESMHLRKLQQGQAHTLAREFFLGMSPEWAEDKSKKEIKEWARVNVDWLQQRFGAERVRFAALHLDEQSPHIAAYVLPLKADAKGRGNGWTLSDRALTLGGSKEALSELQTEYAEAMERFNLRRGIKGSKATHQKTAAWRKQMARPLDAPIVKPKPEAPTMTDHLNPEAYGQRVADATAKAIFNQMKPYHQQAKKRADELKELRGLVARLKPMAEAFKHLLMRLLGHTPNLDSMEGLKRAQEALNRFVAAAVPKAPSEEPEKPQSKPANAPASSQRPSPRRGLPPSSR